MGVGLWDRCAVMLNLAEELDQHCLTRRWVSWHVGVFGCGSVGWVGQMGRRTEPAGEVVPNCTRCCLTHLWVFGCVVVCGLTCVEWDCLQVV